MKFSHSTYLKVINHVSYVKTIKRKVKYKHMKTKSNQLRNKQYSYKTNQPNLNFARPNLFPEKSILIIRCKNIKLSKILLINDSKIS